MTNAELIKALRECEYCNVCSIAVDGDCPFGGRDALEVAAANALEEMSNDIEKHYIPLLESWQKRAQSRLLKIQEMKKETEELLSETANVVKINERLKAQMPKEGEWIEEQRGRWIYAKCNLCGKVQDVRSNYCPNCGAKMDGERKDGENEQ